MKDVKVIEIISSFYKWKYVLFKKNTEFSSASNI